MNHQHILTQVENVIRNNKMISAFMTEEYIDKCKKIANNYLLTKKFVDTDFATAFFEYSPLIIADIFKVLYPAIPDDQKFEMVKYV